MPGDLQSENKEGVVSFVVSADGLQSATVIMNVKKISEKKYVVEIKE